MAIRRAFCNRRENKKMRKDSNESLRIAALWNFWNQPAAAFGSDAVREISVLLRQSS
jgi:hypothetical protein